MAGGTPCRGYDPVRRTTGRTGLSDRRERRRAGFGDGEFHPGELPGGGNFRCRNAGGVENRFRFWPGGVFFGFRRFGLFGRSVLPVNRGPCLYIVRKKTPAYVTDTAIFYPGVLHLRENSLHLYGPSDDFGFRSQKIGPGGCSAWFCGALFYVPYLTQFKFLKMKKLLKSRLFKY